MKTVAIIAIVIAICIIGAGYYFVSGEKWGYDNTDINNLRFKLQIKFKDGSTTDINAPMTIMYDNKVIESIIYYAEIKGTSDVYDTFEVTEVGTHYTLTSKDATDRTDYIKDKTFYDEKITTYKADGQWRELINQAFTTTFLEIDPDITPLTELPYGDYKVWLNGHFKYRYGSVDWTDFNMDSSSVIIHYAEDVVKIEVSGGTNLDNDDGDSAGETPDDWEPPEEEPPEQPSSEIVITNTDLHGTSGLFRQNVGQSFCSGEMTYIKEIKIKTGGGGTVSRIILSDDSRNLFDMRYDSKSLNVGWNAFTINTEIRKNTNYTFMIYGDTIHYRCTLYDSYPDGYETDSSTGKHYNWDLIFKIYGEA